MTLKKVTPSVELLECAFCGALSVDENEARGRGCTDGPPRQVFAEGETVLARLPLYDTSDSPARQLGYKKVRAKVLKLEAPIDVCGPTTRIVARGRNNDDRRDLLVELPKRRHVWSVTVEPLVKHDTIDGYHGEFCTCTVSEYALERIVVERPDYMFT